MCLVVILVNFNRKEKGLGIWLFYRVVMKIKNCKVGIYRLWDRGYGV